MSLKALALLALVALGACSTAEPIWAPDTAIAQARFVAPAPRSITLYTVISNRNNSGAHSGLLINASEQVMFDPAGSWTHPRVPERNDVHFGVTPKMVNFYIDYHARETFRVVEQTLIVSPEVAELVKARAMAYGAVPKAQCANSISTILDGVPGFEGLKGTWFPNKLSESFGTLPGVVSRTITDDDADSNHGVLILQSKAELADAELAARAAAAQ
jgi:hypothetical protein